MPISSRCFAPSRGFFSKDGKCGRESVENGLCEFHWNILCCAPPNPAKSFPFSDKCKICGMCVRGFYENGICESCMPSSESKNITIENASKLLNININILQSIENGELETLTNDVFTIGHIRTYLKWLEIDPNLIK